MTKRTETKKPLYAVRDFRDAGTEHDFKAGDDVSEHPGAENYVAAGLASDVAPDKASEAVLG